MKPKKTQNVGRKKHTETNKQLLLKHWQNYKKRWNIEGKLKQKKYRNKESVTRKLKRKIMKLKTITKKYLDLQEMAGNMKNITIIIQEFRGVKIAESIAQILNPKMDIAE